MEFTEGSPAYKTNTRNPFLISKFKFSWNKQPTGEVWKEIYLTIRLLKTELEISI